MPQVDTDALRDALTVIIAGNLWVGISARYRQLDRDPDGEGLEKVTWAWAKHGRERMAADYAAAVAAIHKAGRQLAAFYESYDVMLSTVLRNPPRPLGFLRQDERELDDFISALVDDMPVTPLANMTGTPAMSLPLAWSTDGLPIGIHMGAAFGREDLLLRLAAQVEQAEPWADKRPEI